MNDNQGKMKKVAGAAIPQYGQVKLPNSTMV